MKIKYCFTFFLIIVILTGCSLSSQETAITDLDHLKIGSSLTIEEIDSRFVLLDNKETLAADGLYYTSWGIGNSKDYTNSDGNIVDLYDAQLYLLLKENRNEKNAKDNIDTWISAAKTNYEILKEEEISCNENSYSLMIYNCKNADNPYAKGISAFGVFNNSSVCIELTCQENFQEDLKTILTNFLNHCSYN